MNILRELWLCSDCMFTAVNGHVDDITDERATEIYDGFIKLDSHVSANFNTDTGNGYNELTSTPCDCCRTRLAGDRYRFAIMGEVRFVKKDRMKGHWECATEDCNHIQECGLMRFIEET